MVTPAEKYPVRSGGRECKLVAIRFTGANGANPTSSLTDDPCNVVDTITRDAEGSYKIKLLTKYRYIMPVGARVASDTQGDGAEIDAVTEGTSATNYLYVTTHKESGGAPTADDLDSVEITVSFFGYAA